MAMTGKDSDLYAATPLWALCAPTVGGEKAGPTPSGPPDALRTRMFIAILPTVCPRSDPFITAKEHFWR